MPRPPSPATAFGSSPAPGPSPAIMATWSWTMEAGARHAPHGALTTRAAGGTTTISHAAEQHAERRTAGSSS